MKVGDLVQYRQWQEGDDQIHTVPLERRGWEETGLVIDIGKWQLGKKTFPQEGILFLNDRGQFIEAWKGDLNVISENKNKRNRQRCIDYWSVFSSISTC